MDYNCLAILRILQCGLYLINDIRYLTMYHVLDNCEPGYAFCQCERIIKSKSAAATFGLLSSSLVARKCMLRVNDRFLFPR